MVAAIVGILAPILGPFTAQTAVKTFARKTLGREADTLVAADVPAFAESLRPLLRTFVGRDRAEVVILRIKREGQR
ncbi:MAG: hypothetical protein HOW73_08845 [Polyangiaceae bacterium]|nr:hypothetical protein [Polyangiaceae bacterium]